ncbi:hypothetical protein ACVWZW_006166 [Bradyrhizobium sp. F1.13.4]
MDGDAGEEADHDRHGQEIGDAAEAEGAAGQHHRTDHQCQRDRESLILRRAGGGQRRQPAGEDRRDRGIGAAGQETVAAEHRKAERPRHESEEADLRGEAAEPCGRHLLGNRDRRKRQAGHEVARQRIGRQRAE